MISPVKHNPAVHRVCALLSRPDEGITDVCQYIPDIFNRQGGSVHCLSKFNEGLWEDEARDEGQPFKSQQRGVHSLSLYCWASLEFLSFPSSLREFMYKLFYR